MAEQAEAQEGEYTKSLEELVKPHRFKCTNCGNLTRFDITRTLRFAVFHHQELDGRPVFEELSVVADTIDSVACRWCGDGKKVIEIDDHGDEVIPDQVAPS